MFRKKLHLLKEPFGFTIIETMIVLAIAGLILVIVFIALPDEQRARRDSAREDYANRVLEALEEFYKNNGTLPACGARYSTPGSCPDAPTGAARFLTKYMPAWSDPSTGSNYTDSTAQAASVAGTCYGTGIPSGNTVYCWDDTNGGGGGFYINHNLVPRLGQIYIAALHPCVGGQHSGGGYLYGSGTIVDINSGGNDISVASVIIGLENGNYYCVTNGTVQ